MQQVKQFIKGASYAELQKAVELIQKEIADRKDVELAKAEVLELMRSKGLSINDFSGEKVESDKRSKVEAKYRIVVDGVTHEWTGRGKRPKAFIGVDLTKHLI